MSFSPTVNGAWSCWSSWSQCSAGCGGGHYQRTRSCSSPSPANTGDICLGLHTEEALCNTHPCDGKASRPEKPPASLRARRRRISAPMIVFIALSLLSTRLNEESRLWVFEEQTGVLREQAVTVRPPAGLRQHPPERVWKHFCDETRKSYISLGVEQLHFLFPFSDF